MNVLLMYQPSNEHRQALESAAPGAELRIATDETSAARMISDADAVLGNRYFLQSLPHAQRLRWMQSNSMGLDRILEAGISLNGATVTCARGLYAAEIAEHATALLLALVRGLHHARDMQNQRQWTRTSLRTVRGSRVLVLGWGTVGQATAHLLTAMGAQVQAVRRTLMQPTTLKGVTIHGPATWRALLPETDAVIMALPATKETRGLISAAELAALPSHAVIVNVGRASAIDESALLTALHSNRLAGAALDVFEPEPLPIESGLWAEPKLLITPHVARSLEQAPYRWEPLFVENLRRFARGEPLLNVVDQQAGY
jgi:phosphoglycerate dehydrogenase-like enzyme